MFHVSSLLVTLCALCTNAQLVEDLIKKQHLPFIRSDDHRQFYVLYYNSGDLIEFSCKKNTTKDTAVFWEISGIRKAVEPCDADAGVGIRSNAENGIRYRQRLRAADDGAYLACVATHGNYTTTSKIYFITKQNKDAEISCREMSELFCPVSSTVGDQTDGITVAVNGKKLTAVSRNSSGLFDYTHYYNSSDRLQIDCSTVDSKAQYVSMCGEAVSDVYAKCSPSETCTKTQIIHPGAGHMDQVLYCYTLLLDNVTQSVARLTLVYNNSNTGSDKMTTSAVTSTYNERVILLPAETPKSEDVRGDESVVSNTTVTSEADAASDPGPNSNGLYILIAVTVLLIIIIIAVIMIICIVRARKKRKVNSTTHGPERLGQEECASERFIENDLYIAGPGSEYAVPWVCASQAPASRPTSYLESAYAYIDPNTITRYSKTFNSVYLDSAAFTRGNATRSFRT